MSLFVEFSNKFASITLLRATSLNKRICLIYCTVMNYTLFSHSNSKDVKLAECL